MIRLLTVTLAFLLGACSFVGTKPAEQAAVNVSIEGQDRIRFSGKGAGAGMMMSASMGSMGIAIGVAIDEGIGKDIHDSFVASGGNFSEIVKSETYAWLSEICQENREGLNELCSSDIALNVRVYRYGFVTTSGENDPVKAELEIGFVVDDQTEFRFNLKKLDDAPIAPQEKAKKEGEISKHLLTTGYQTLLKAYCSKILM